MCADWCGGDRWRNPANVFQQEPFRVTNLPTIIKVTGDGVSFMGFSMIYTSLEG